MSKLFTQPFLRVIIHHVMQEKDQKNPMDDVSFAEENHEIEDLELEDEEGLAAEKLKKLRTKLKACEEERRSQLEEVQRARADFLNSKRRLEEQLVRDKERSAAQHVESLLPLCDSFEFAMNDPSWTDCEEKWRKGVEGIYAQLLSTLRSHGVTEVGKEGEMFDPHEHEAVTSIPVDDAKKSGTIIAVLQKGYKMGDTILRPAKVSVGAEV